MGDLRIRTLATPGHTPGSICFAVEGTHLLFTGDTLFPGGPGNTAFEGGDFATIIQSIDRRIFAAFDADTLVLPGHGDVHHGRQRVPPPAGMGRARLVRTAGRSPPDSRRPLSEIPDQNGRLLAMATTPLLEIRDLHVSAEDGAILRGVDLSVGAGEIHALMGPNGAGKSTLAGALMGHPAYTVTSGAILLNGEDVTALGHRRAGQGRPLPGLPVPRVDRGRLGHPVPAPGHGGPQGHRRGLGARGPACS